MINHLYWSVVSTADGNGEMMKAKWLSLVNHIHDQHTGHSCSHGALVGRDEKWLKRRMFIGIVLVVI